ncbi:hypothetical protein H0H93_010656 [Arthromyces matolae]|nr:hypothetical protein H0H93_010656 [Arthromyces matolae]
MSLESSSGSDETSQTLSVVIRGVSSPDSSLVPSPTGILSVSSSTTSSSTSLEGKLNVKFAPLPELAPRKRRSVMPLGVAARSQMMVRRRQQRAAHVDAYNNSPMWTPEELEKQREIAMREGRRRVNHHHLVSEEEGAEDPFLALGKMVKVAGQSIWRKVSSKEVPKRDLKAVLEKSGERSRKENKPTTASVENSMEEQESVLEPRTSTDSVIDEMDVDVDMEEDDDEYRTISQTETIRDADAKFVWMTEETDESDQPTPDSNHLQTPTQTDSN